MLLESLEKPKMTVPSLEDLCNPTYALDKNVCFCTQLKVRALTPTKTCFYLGVGTAYTQIHRFGFFNCELAVKVV